MEIINVVYLEDCCIESIKSFPIVDNSTREFVKASAELYFKKTILEINEYATEDEIETAYEDEYYDYNCADKRVEIIWSI